MFERSVPRSRAPMGVCVCRILPFPWGPRTNCNCHRPTAVQCFVQAERKLPTNRDEVPSTPTTRQLVSTDNEDEMWKTTLILIFLIFDIFNIQIFTIKQIIINCPFRRVLPFFNLNLLLLFAFWLLRLFFLFSFIFF